MSDSDADGRASVAPAWIVQGAVVICKHRKQLKQAPRLRSFDLG